MSRALIRSSLALVQWAVYALALALPIAMTRFEGGVAFIWVGTALLVAKLLVTPERRWPLVLGICCLTNAAITVRWGLGPWAALPISVVNISEAVVAALVFRRLTPNHNPDQALRWLLALVLAIGVVAPLLTALPAGLIVNLATGKPLIGNAIGWYSGHALGSITVAPIALMATHGQLGRWFRRADARRRAETVAATALIGAVVAAVFAQDGYPLLFLPVLALLTATFRIGRFGAALGIVVLAIIGGALTLLGHGPIGMIDAPLGPRIQFLQLYLAATTLTILPVAASLAHRNRLIRRLRESEARYRLITDNSTDIVLNLDRQGKMKFISPSIRQFGLEPEDVIGADMLTLVDPEDRDAVRTSHAEAFAATDRTVAVQFRSTGLDGVTRWFEARSRAVRDENGQFASLVTASRDISDGKAREERLARDAATDPLTGLANRRSLIQQLEAAIAAAGAGGASGSIAILDIDHFKAINDGHGHDVGDMVLQQFAQQARDAIGAEGMVARLGGEEFAVFLPGIALAEAQRRCDMLRAAVADTRMLVGRAILAITISGGVAHYGPGARTDAVLRAADLALYRAKQAGRDRMAVAARSAATGGRSELHRGT